MLAWIRTAIAIIGLGFVISRFGLLLRQIEPKSEPATGVHFSTITGATFIAVGILSLLFALWHFLHTHHEIENDAFRPSLLFTLIVVLTIAGVGVLLFIYLLVVG
ncbi:membrane protein [Ktedonospora formicarum]|uniref:Membrane protein n=2 Tax=Ktedonospora formicarum TaxID=2778364 RepID=A0A8J3HWM0_9CHLR|nr:membrane protein [Ktedonospora formicarum]